MTISISQILQNHNTHPLLTQRPQNIEKPETIFKKKYNCLLKFNSPYKYQRHSSLNMDCPCFLTPIIVTFHVLKALSTRKRLSHYNYIDIIKVKDWVQHCFI